jgi:hypothetical protein
MFFKNCEKPRGHSAPDKSGVKAARPERSGSYFNFRKDETLSLDSLLDTKLSVTIAMTYEPPELWQQKSTNTLKDGLQACPIQCLYILPSLSCFLTPIAPKMWCRRACDRYGIKVNNLRLVELKMRRICIPLSAKRLVELKTHRCGRACDIYGTKVS